ncbi:hypothetical protein TTHT_0407 [Thermotomaculum hydrothermale]|uniref:Uncharacterized protein n=1 Tax=Thermotomaculum hydrothermale TaxID=981385 RepID=A0A7R6SXP1_9BACT|nr:hypothetical protein [Thermotomaculum hydrothermale]BBB32009.1 hypothetical protein TTHT_0407 [Thermotomaculum hydrothermale]
MKLIKKLKPVFDEDYEEWNEIVSEINGFIPPLFWYGGAAFDMEPIVSLFNGSFPKDAQRFLSPNIFPVLTDYNSKICEAIKYIYEHFYSENFSIDSLPRDYWFRMQLKRFEILQMIPLTLFDPDELMKIRSNYKGFHSSVTTSVVPDDKWHFVFINAAVEGENISFLYGLIENLVFWKEVVESNNLKIESFCGLRLGGKSGSWDFTHSPSSGKLFNAIRNSKASKPKLWIADECYELRKIWREIEPHDNGFYGQMHFFEAKWDF